MKSLILTLIFVFTISLDSVHSWAGLPQIRKPTDLYLFNVGQVVDLFGDTRMVYSPDENNREIKACRPLRDNEAVVFNRIAARKPRFPSAYYIPQIKYAAHDKIEVEVLGRGRIVIAQNRKIGEEWKMLEEEKFQHGEHNEDFAIHWGYELMRRGDYDRQTREFKFVPVATYWNNMWLPEHLLPKPGDVC